MLSDDLSEAFAATIYRIFTPAGVFDLQIGKRHPAFEAFLARHAVTNYGIITSHNPTGQLSLAKNCHFEGELRQAILRLKLLTYYACNIACNNDWPDERSYFLLGISEAEILALANRFRQLAVVTGGVGAAPQLLWLC